MNSLLGNYLSIGDLIVVHICGETKDVSFKKKFEFLGLTITDNGFGRAFVKRVNSQDKEICNSIKPGQHIIAINSESTVGLRHFEVARALREVPTDSEISLRLVEPMFSQENEDDDQLITLIRNEDSEADKSMIRLNNYNSKLDSQSTAASTRNDSTDSPSDELINSSLPIDQLLRNTGSPSVNQAIYKHIIEDINSILESFLGIHDTTLAIQIYRLSRENKDSFESFVRALRSSELSVFKFGPDTEKSLWTRATLVESPPVAN